MVATLTQPAPRANCKIFESPMKKWRQRRRDSDIDHVSEQLQQQAEEESKAQAANYLLEFLNESEWNTLLDRITIVWACVPSMQELESYGDLDEKDGTIACRRLFKAVVIWDELGHSLWKVLKATSIQRQLEPVAMMGRPWTQSSAGLAAAKRRLSEDSTYSSSSSNQSRISILPSMNDRDDVGTSARTYSLFDLRPGVCECAYCGKVELPRSYTAPSVSPSSRRPSDARSALTSRSLPHSTTAGAMRRKLSAFTMRRQSCGAK